MFTTLDLPPLQRRATRIIQTSVFICCNHLVFFGEVAGIHRYHFSNMDLALNSFGVNQDTMQDEYMKWLVTQTACCLSQETKMSFLSLQKSVDIFLPFIGDLKFSPIWILLIDKITTTCCSSEASNLFQKVDQEIFNNILKGDQLSLSVLLHLWQTNLPSLEFFVLHLLHHIIQESPSNPQHQQLSSNILKRSLLVRAVHHEPLIYCAVQCMLNSLLEYPELATAVQSILKALAMEKRNSLLLS
ncbi:hypothetical protein PoB_000376300 [Plakobranchus ocellatus]|uniref:Uncharacterized protein n=1 Tax=Plakobranchus ocellatus TaxID=259542 RepID=A0AAV3Y4Z9_9GAST|nr:hypothetical protein PoB_000376300 [Plakobranchus ocellatus]